MIMQMVGAWELTGVSMFSIIEKASGKWVGRAGPWQPFAWPGTEVGWGLHPDAWHGSSQIGPITSTTGPRRWPAGGRSRASQG